MANPTIEGILEDLKNTITHAKLCHEAWWFLRENRPDRDQILSVYRKYRTFFNTIQPALYTSFAVKLASVFDNSEDSINLKTLQREIQKVPNPPFKPKISFNKIWERGRRLYKYRSKVIAHRDRDVPIRNFAKETGFIYNDLINLLSDTCEFINESAKFLGKPGLPNFSIEDNFKAIIEKLT
ncbi:MAG: hypothetical protein JRJ54_15495 [Deltaproteobacteria bacterium]|nr:hypothetical protein [Deltaproteobacteria bacterium]